MCCKAKWSYFSKQSKWMILNDPNCIYKQRQGWWNSEDSNLNFWNFVVVTMWQMSMHHVSHWWCHVMWWHLKSWCILLGSHWRDRRRHASTYTLVFMDEWRCFKYHVCVWNCLYVKPREYMYIYTFIFTIIHGMDIFMYKYVHVCICIHMYPLTILCVCICL